MSNSKEPDTYGMQKSVRDLLQSLNFNITDANFKETPLRVAKMYKELLYGEFDLEKQVDALFKTKFPSTYDGMIVETGITAVSLCPHHLAQVFYTVHVGYISKNEVVGLSKIPRLVKLLGARAIMQEDFTKDIANCMMDNLQGCQGVIVQVRGFHTCVASRGIKDTGCYTHTSSVRGIFETDHSAKSEFLQMVKNHIQ